MPLIISSHIMMVMWGHASLMAFATLVTWLRKSCSTVRPGVANHCFDSSPSPRIYTFRSQRRGWQRIVDWLSTIADNGRLVLTSSAPMCSVFRPGCSFSTCLSISITSLTPSSLCGFRVPTQYGASLRFHMGRCFSTNYDIKIMAAGHWCIKNGDNIWNVGHSSPIIHTYKQQSGVVASPPCDQMSAQVEWPPSPWIWRIPA